MGRLSVEHILLPSDNDTPMLVAATDTTATNYPGDNRCRCYQSPQAGPGVTKLGGAALGGVVQ